MKKEFCYEKFFDQALKEIKEVRDPKSTKSEYSFRNVRVEENKIFSFFDEEFKYNFHIVRSADDILNKYLSICILELFDFYDMHINVISANTSDYMIMGYEKTKKLFLIFKRDVEYSQKILLKDSIPEYANEFIGQYEVDRCIIVYYVYDNAYLQVFNYDKESNGIGKGYNLYSLMDIVEMYFGDNEAKRMRRALVEYNEKAKKYLSISFVRGLSSNALINFKRILENELLSFNYERSKFNKNDYEILYDRFINQYQYRILLGNSDFAESLITAEWMYLSMKEAQAIDLTVIGLGYIKCVEQLLFSLICLHVNEGKIISTKDKKEYELTDKVLKQQPELFSIGNMAHFYKEYTRKDILINLKNPEIVKEHIFAYKDSRNRYFHKCNIRDWKEIDKTRKETYNLLFLLISSKKNIEMNYSRLGVENEYENDDFNKLCEYIDYFVGTMAVFIFCYNGEELPFFAAMNTKKETIDSSFVKYSGVYFKPLMPKAKPIYYNRETVPDEIYIGRLKIFENNRITLQYIKEKLIYKNGKFKASLVLEKNSIVY